MKYYMYAGPTAFDACKTFDDLDMCITFLFHRLSAEVHLMRFFGGIE